MNKTYYPYPSTDSTHKYFIITSTGKKVNFGRKGYEDFTIHKDEKKKQLYINRHKREKNNFGTNQE